MTAAGKFARDWLPPALRRLLRTTIMKRDTRFSGIYADWDAAAKGASGYDSAVILERVKRTTLKVKTGEIAFERDSIAFREIQHSFPLLAGLLRAGIENGNRLSVLDFGGALGSSYFQCRDFLSALASLKWSVVEQEHYVRCGQAHFTDDSLRFYFSIADCIRKADPNVAVLSSVLQYVPQPSMVLGELTNSAIQYVLIDRTPFAIAPGDVITVQHVPASIYAASYPSWIFARERFLNLVGNNYRVLAEFDSSDGIAQVGQVEFKFGGMILRRR